ncbi:MAG TPA: type II toxin-antitoxin system VapC family toxin [Coriobacteriia bacterium]|nr:type II toxin-antitoxin system VapC family toxin [Coriobacteriia bacterium]
MMPLVTDASVLFKCLLPEPGSIRARQLLERPTRPIAPEIVIAECANAVWERAHRGLIDVRQAMELQGELLAIPIDARSIVALTPAALALSLEYDHPVYDCYYLAAAIEADCEFATADASLYDLAQRVGLGVRAILVR